MWTTLFVCTVSLMPQNCIEQGKCKAPIGRKGALYVLDLFIAQSSQRAYSMGFLLFLSSEAAKPIGHHEEMKCCVQHRSRHPQNIVFILTLCGCFQFQVGNVLDFQISVRHKTLKLAEQLLLQTTFSVKPTRCNSHLSISLSLQWNLTYAVVSNVTKPLNGCYQ